MKTTIILLVQNKLEQLILCLRSLTDFVEMSEMNLIISDFSSEDGLREWAVEQVGFTYIYFEKNEATYGKALNEIINTLDLSGDILVMTPEFLFTPNCIDNMKRAFLQDIDIGAAGPVSNIFALQRVLLKDYEEAVLRGLQVQNVDTEYTLGVDGRVVLFREGIFQRNGGFDEKLQSLQEVMLDFMFRLICRGNKVVRCRNAVFWGMLQTAEGQCTRKDREYLRNKWGMNYFNIMPNLSLIQMIDKNPQDSFKVLEVGCDCGANLLEIKNYFPKAELYGLEINESAAGVARHVVNVLQGDIEQAECDFKVHFDYIVFGDVLEHLHNPLQTILHCRNLLKESGCIIACIPNVQHISVVEDLINVNFTYRDEGLLDRTHIHLFTYKEILSMFEKADYKIENVITRELPLEKKQKELVEKLVELSEGSEAFMFETFQYVIRARI